MKLSQLVIKSMQKNMRHYYLYFFALIFSVTLFFSFVTLQYNESVIEATKASGTAAAGFEAASYMLYFIVLVFVLYANHLFIKRRSKEIGLYQMIGMTKQLVIRLIALENIVLFAGAVSVGMGLGLLSSRLFAMILLKVLQFEAIVTLSFSQEAIVRTVIVFSVLLIIILVQMAFMVRRTSLLSLFTASKQADERVKQFSAFPMIMGAIGLALIFYGYYKSAVLFSKDTMNLFTNMIIILATTISGTFLVFRFSVAFVMNLYRLSKKGHLKLVDVLAVTPIMHRMKSNSKSLTLITVLTAVSLAITTLSYISYFSAGETAKSEVPAHYISIDGKETAFLKALDERGIDYTVETTRMTGVTSDGTAFLTKELAEDMADRMNGDTDTETMMIPLSDYKRLHPNLEIGQNEIVVTSYNSIMTKIMPIKKGMKTVIKHGENILPVTVKEVHEDTILSWRITANGPVYVVSDEIFDQFKQWNEVSPVWDKKSVQTGINLKDENDIPVAEKLYKQTGANKINEEGAKFSSRYASEQHNLNIFGTTIFITAFLGLAFLLATGSILYFKQMSEADEEMESYKILRKIGFTQEELTRGIMMKQLFNFGVPLLIGLLHSYFAVKSGWFLFGTELTTPLIVTMALYIVMYIVFAAFTINYYRKIIKQAL